jgi:hypothetical protein
MTSEVLDKEVADFIDSLEGKTFEELDAIRIQLRGDSTTLDELPESELEKMCAVLARQKLTRRTAAKPKANGASRDKQPADILSLLAGMMVKKN